MEGVWGNSELKRYAGSSCFFRRSRMGSQRWLMPITPRSSWEPGTSGGFNGFPSLSNRKATVADSCGSGRQPGMMVNRLISVFILHLQFIMEKHCIFAKCRLSGRIDIRKKIAVQFLAGLRVKPDRLWLFYDDGAKQSVDILFFSQQEW